MIQMTHTTIKLDTRNCLKLEGMPEDFVHIKLNSTESHMKKQKADQWFVVEKGADHEEAGKNSGGQ